LDPIQRAGHGALSAIRGEMIVVNPFLLPPYEIPTSSRSHTLSPVASVAILRVHRGFVRDPHGGALVSCNPNQQRMSCSLPDPLSHTAMCAAECGQRAAEPAGGRNSQGTSLSAAYSGGSTPAPVCIDSAMTPRWTVLAAATGVAGEGHGGYREAETGR
jgi:hypothetical protein